MELEVVRRIRGNVHGTVDLTELEDQVLSHPFVQRLRRIRQLAFLSYVFPGATHSRFEHSLGVMQLAGLTWSKMRLNQQRLKNTCLRYDDFAEIERRGVGGMTHGLLAPAFSLESEVFDSAYTLQALRLAGFLHDLGHPPFSHSGELFLPTWEALLNGLPSFKDVPDYLISYLKGRVEVLRASGRDPAKVKVRHEVYTLLLVNRVMMDVYRTHGESQGSVAARDILAIISPEIEPEPSSPLRRHGIYKLCNELISGEVDIDRMDYLLRDSRECGVVYGIFDATRIQDSLAIYENPQDGHLHLAINFSGLAAFEDYLRARHSMYLQLYYHKTSVSCEAMMQHLSHMLGGWTLPIGEVAFAELDEYNIESKLLEVAKEGLEGEKYKAFAQLLRDLLRDRRLWKRVYEMSSTDGRASQAQIEKASAIISGLGVPFERLSSSSSLTRFRPREEHQMSRNYLRLIKKDEYQFPRVMPIEDHSDLISSNSRVHIDRIYVPEHIDENGESLAGRVKRILTARLREG